MLPINYSLLAIVGIIKFVSSISNSPFSSLALTELFKRSMLYKTLNLFQINNYKVVTNPQISG